MNLTAGFKRYFFNTSWLMTERVFRIAVTLFVGVYIARYLGPEQFGLLSYALSFVGLFIALASLGLDGVVIRDLVKTPERRDELLGTAFVLKSAGALLMWILIVTALQFTGSDLQTMMMISIIAFSAIFQAFNVIDFYYQSAVKSKLVVHVQLLQVFLSGFIKLALIAFEASLIWFAWAYLFDAFVLAVGLSIIYLRYSGKISTWRIKFHTAKALLKDSWPLVLSAMAVSVYMKIDQIMIKEMLGAYEVGQYAVAVKLSEAWYFIPTTISTSLFPAVINAQKDSSTIYLQRMKSLYRMMFYLAISIALPITFLSPWLIDLLFGMAYHQAAPVLKIHIWAGVFIFLGIANIKRLVIENLQKIIMINTSIGAVINVILNLILINKYGIIGAAISTIISYCYASYLGLLLFKKTRKSFIDISTFFIDNNFIKINN